MMVESIETLNFGAKSSSRLFRSTVPKLSISELLKAFSHRDLLAIYVYATGNDVPSLTQRFQCLEEVASQL
jgi:hypothetical protein